MPTVTTNLAGLKAANFLSWNDRKENESLSKLSSGSKIVRASDDASGLAVSNSLQSDTITLKQASQNIQQAISMLNTLDSGVERSLDILNRMKTITVMGNTGYLNTVDRVASSLEYRQLNAELSNIQNQSEYNNVYLFGFTGAFQVGTDAAADVININLAITANPLFVGGIYPPQPK